MNEIIGVVVALAAAFGGAFYGARLQRSSNLDSLALELQIDAAARFMGALGELSIGYANSNKPGTEELSPSERDEPAYIGFIAVKSQAAAVAIVGPDRLAEIADQILENALDAGFDHGVSGVGAYVQIEFLAEQFKAEAKKLRPKGGRKRSNAQKESDGSAPIPPMGQ